MSDMHQLHQDLQYVRDVVTRSEETPPRTTAIYWIWAIYVVIGCSLIDFAPHLSGPFFMLGWIAAFIATGMVAHHTKKRSGVRTHSPGAALFWFGGSILIVLCCIGISVLIPG